MTTVIPQRDLRNNNAVVMAAVVAGETFVVTRHGTPVAKLRPIVGAHPIFVARTALASLATQGPRLDAARFRADGNRLIDQEL